MTSHLRAYVGGNVYRSGHYGSGGQTTSSIKRTSAQTWMEEVNVKTGEISYSFKIINIQSESIF